MTTQAALAGTIALHYLEMGYVQAALDGGWDPMRSLEMGYVQAALNGWDPMHYPAGLPLSDEHAPVEQEVRAIFSAAVSAAREVQQAVQQSLDHDEIVTLDYSEERAAALSALCDDWTDGNDEYEYWGNGPSDDDEDMAWRVHLVLPDETPEPEIDDDVED